MIVWQEEKHLDPRRIARSLNRSDVRGEVYLHLCSVCPNEETLAEISTAIEYDVRSILGALIGDGHKYKPEDALVSLGLAIMKEYEYHGQKVMTFCAASNGEDVNELLRDYARHNNLPTKLKEYIKRLEGNVKKIGGRLKWKK